MQRLSLITAQLVRLIISWASLFVALLMRPSILVYTVDFAQGDFKCDERIEQLYVFLRKRNIIFFEIIHVRAGWSFLKTFLKRARPVFYIESIDTLYKIIGAKPNRDPIMRFIVSLLRPKHIWSIDDYRGHQNALLRAGVNKKVPVHIFQHGRFNQNNDMADKVLPTKYVVWNNYWKNRLLMLSDNLSEDHILVGGKPSRSHAPITQHRHEHSIVIPYEPKANPEIIKHYIKNLSEKYHIIFKLRSDIPIEQQIHDADIEDFVERGVVDVTTTFENVPLIAGTYSTMLYEAPQYGVAVGVLETPTTEAEDLLEDGIAGIIQLDSACEDAAAIIKDDLLRQNAKKLTITADIQDTLRDIY